MLAITSDFPVICGIHNVGDYELLCTFSVSIE